MSLIKQFQPKELFLLLKTNWQSKNIPFYLILIAVFCLGFSKSIFIAYPDFYLGKFNFLSTSKITITTFFLLLGSTIGILIKRKEIKINEKWIFTLSLILLVLSLIKKDPNYFNYIAVFAFLLFSTTFKKKELKLLINIFLKGVLFQIFLAIFQFLFQMSSNLNLLHFLGEPNLDITTKGISKLNINNLILFRSYGTTNHPNFLGNLILISILLSPLKFKIIKYLGLLTTFSLSNLSSILLKSLINNKKKIQTLSALTLIAIIGFIKFQDPNYQGISERIFQLKNFFSFNSISQLITGTPFITNNLTTLKLLPWELQPIHNHYLLIFTYYGLTGLFFIILLSKKLVKDNKLLFITLLPPLLLDHFYLTLPNGLVLASLIFILSKEISISAHKVSD